MKKLLLLLSASFALSLGFTSCSDDDDDDPVTPSTPANVVVEGTLTGVTTWTNDRIYELNGRVIVPTGATLNIAPGTIIKGRAGQDANASVLVVARGGTINAPGTAEAPIIFTSIADNIQIGQRVGTNLNRDDNELWGGLIVLGSARISAENGDTETSIEGIPPSDANGRYGGNDDADNSGVLTYISVRHGGISIGDGNEINGITFGGVGNGTTVSNIEVYATLDDGIEFFGGSVNVSNALVYYQGDDGVDIDMNYSGTVNGFAVIHGAGIGTDEGMEIDGPENSTYTDGRFTLVNGVVRSEDTSEGSATDLKSGAQGTLRNITWDYGTRDVKIRASYQNSCADPKSDAFTNLTDSPATLEIIASSMNGVEVYTDSDNGGTPPIECSVQPADQTAAENAVDVSGAGASIDLAATFGWTAAGLRGQL